MRALILLFFYFYYVPRNGVVSIIEITILLLKARCVSFCILYVYYIVFYTRGKPLGSRRARRRSWRTSLVAHVAPLKCAASLCTHGVRTRLSCARTRCRVSIQTLKLQKKIINIIVRIRIYARAHTR